MRPIAPHLFSMTWRYGLFAHWPVDPAALRPHVPAPLALDTRDGRAWLSVLPFVLADAGVRGAPGPARLTFPELNVRTYVRLDGTPGLYFFSIDVAHWLVPALVRTATRLPCYAADARVRVDDDRVEFESVRRDDPGARFDATYRPDGEVYHAEPGSLDHWLMERRRLYAPEGESVLYGEIEHDPWSLQSADATIRENTVFDAADLPTPDGEPRVRYSGDLSMTGSILRRISAAEIGTIGDAPEPTRQ